MNITDSIYGKFKLDRVLEELIESQPVQRLKGIYQGGASYFVNEKWNVTRYDHSIGVMLLIRRLGGSLEEQIAGLLHDVSHTAFSHVIDFVLENKAEDYHEQIYPCMITDSEIPQILSHYGFDSSVILFDHSQWTLLEQQAPDLCADRIDYTLRDMYHYGHISIEEINDFLDQLVVIDGVIYLMNLQAAEWFTATYYKEVIDFFMDPLNGYGYKLLSKTLKTALDKKLISLNTLLGTDEEVMKLLRSFDDIEIKALTDQIHPHVIVKEDKQEYDFHHRGKVRLIDPMILEERPCRSSELSQEIQIRNQQAKRKAEAGTFIKVISTR